MRPFVALLLSLFSLSAAAQDAPLTIDRAVELAVRNNERAAIADEATEAAESRLRRARAFFFPQVDVNGVYQARDFGDAKNFLSTTATATQTLFNARAFPLFRQARLELDATKLTAGETRRLLAYDAANAFVIALSFEQVLRASENRREFARTSLEDARARFDAGLVSSNDVTKAELELATAELGVAESRGDVESARIELGNLLNAAIAGPLVEPVELLAAADDAPTADAGTVTTAQQQRNDIAAARLRVEALREFAKEPRARFLPSLTLNAQSRNFNEESISDRNNESFIGVSLNWSVFDAGIRAAETAEREAVARGAELQLGLQMRDVDRQLRGAAVQLTSEQAAIRQADAALRAARKNADETNELYRQGLATALDLATATQQLFAAEVAESTARYRMALAYLALREAAGAEVLGRTP